MPDLPIIYTIRLDMQEDVTEEANLWNNTRHISDLLGSGFLSAVRFRSLKGEPEYLHLYELPNIDLLSTESYKNVRKYDDWGPKLSHGFSNHSASLYNQLVTVNIADTPRTFEEPRDGRRQVFYGRTSAGEGRKSSGTRRNISPSFSMSPVPKRSALP